jgi:hypothetical protein
VTRNLIVSGLAIAALYACNQRAEPARSPEPRLVPASGVTEPAVEPRTNELPPAPVAPPPPGSEAAPPPLEESTPAPSEPGPTELGPPPPMPEQNPYEIEPLHSGPHNWLDEDGNVVTEALVPR